MGLILGSSAASGSLTVDLDGSPTAHQIAITVDGTGYSQGTDATMRWRETGGSWTTGHDLFRVQSSIVDQPPWGAIADVYAWSILGLTPDTEYEVEVTIGSDLGTLTTTTKALPPAAGSADVTITDIADLENEINNASAGDVIEIADGTYVVDTIDISNNISASNPIYVRGESRDGVILDKNVGGQGNALFQFTGTTAGIVFENFTVEGPGGTGNTVEVFGNFNDGGQARDITVRDITVTGVRRFIYQFFYADRWLVYDNTVEGRNPWTSARYETNAAWDDYGIHLPGNSNDVFNNTLTGFGDVISFANSSNGDEPYNNHAHNNDIYNAIDDTFEADDGTRNLSFYDNRITNCQNISSLDPLYGGPLINARNIYINVARRYWLKWNDNSSGMFYYNNTAIGTGSGTVISVPPDTFGPGLDSIIDQPQGQTVDYFAVDNNLFIADNTNILTMNPSGMNNVDWRNNYWYPDGAMNFSNPDDYTSVANANSTSTTNFTPVFGSQTRFVETDGVSEADPFVTSVVLGADESTEVTIAYRPRLASGSNPKNNGVAVAGITDGYTGDDPDVGAVIDGRSDVVFGDRGNTRLRQVADTLAAGGSDLDITEFRNDQVWNNQEITWCSNCSFYDANRKEIQYVTKPQSSQTSASENYAHYIYSESGESWSNTGYDLGSTTGHVYSTAFDPDNGEIFFLDWGADDVRRYDRADSSWSDTPTDADLPGGQDWTAGMVYHPNLFGAGDGGLIFCPTGDTDAQVWRRSTNTWVTLSDVSCQNGLNNGGQGIYIPGLDAAMIAGFSGSVYRVDAGSGGTIGSATDLGNQGTPNIGWENGPSSGHGKAIIDPNDSSRVLVLEFGGTSRVWATTDAGDTFTEVGNHPFASMTGYSGLNITYTSIPDYGVIVGMTSFATPAHRFGMWKPDV